MKNNLRLNLLIILLAFTIKGIGQSTIVGHVSNPFRYLGWNAFSNQPVRIKHEGNRPINFHTDAGAGTFNNLRMTILPNTFTLGFNTSGFVGLNNPNPLWNLDGITRQLIPGWRRSFLFTFYAQNFLTNVRATENEMGLWNASGNGFAPTFYGKVGATMPTPAIVLLGTILAAQDFSTGQNLPVHQFRVGRDLTIGTTGITQLAAITNRAAFGWFNGTTLNMWMNARGQLRIGDALSTLTNTPRNRIEITSALVDPYGITGSGLRFTNLTSTNVVTPNGTNGTNYNRVLTVDGNGDVVLIPGSGIANNGLSIVNGSVQLGATCNSATVSLANLTSNREIPLNGNNLVISAPTATLGAFGGRVGIGRFINCAPGNMLEVNDGVPGPLSGLRLTDLAANPPALANPFNKVLAVNISGDVILTNLPPGGSALGGPCPSTNSLTVNWEIPLNNNNFLFGGNGTGTVVNNVGIGTTCLPQAKLHVEQNSLTNGGSTGIFVENKDNNACIGAPIIGLKSLVSSTNLNDVKCAGWFESVNAPNCFGSLLNYAIIVPQNGGMVEIGYNPINLANLGAYLLDVNGGINANVYFTNSDVTLKNTITTLPNSLNKIKSLRPVTYKWNTVNDSSMTGIHAGFIAQEVDTVIPQVVRTGSNGKKTVAYSEIIPYLVSAMQEQQKQIKHLDSLVTALTQSVSSCCSNSSARQTGITGNTPNSLNQLNIDLSDKDVIVLNQNEPNPFAEQTTITYNVPEKYGYAQLIFKTIDGKIIKTVDITKKGRGVVNVFANDLSNGLYMYSLVVDGATIDTKKMVKQN